MPAPLRLLAACAALSLVTALGACSGDEPKTVADPEVSAAEPAGARLVQEGLDQLAAGDTAAAATTFDDVLAVDPGNVYAHYNLGVIAQGAGHERAAMKEYDAALASDAHFAPALYNKAMLSESSDLEAAVDLYEEAADADPTMAPAFMRLGFALVHLGRTEEGEEALGRAVELDPSMKDVEAPTYE